MRIHQIEDIACLSRMTEALTRYSLEDVAKRDGSDGARVWIVINDMVIDVTDSIDQVYHSSYCCVMYFYSIKTQTISIRIYLNKHFRYITKL